MKQQFKINNNTLKISIRTKITSVIIFLISLLILIYSVVSIKNQKKSLESELNNTVEIMRTDLVRKGRALTSNISLLCSNAIATNNFDFLQKVINSTVNGDVDTIFGFIANNDKMIFVHNNPDLRLTKLSENYNNSLSKIKDVQVLDLNKNKTDNILEIAAPIKIAKSQWGFVSFGFTLKHLNKEVQKANLRIISKIQESTITALITMVSFIIIGIFLSIFISKKLTGPIEKLKKDVDIISNGNYKNKIIPSSNDEIGALASTFDNMRISIFQKIADLESIFQIGRKLALVTDYETVFKLGYDAISSRFSVDDGALYLSNEEADVINKVAEFSKIDTLESLTKPETLTGDLYPYNIVIMEQHLKTIANSDNQIILLPLSYKGKSFGLIELKINNKNNAPTKEQLFFTETICNSMAISLKNIELFAETAEKAKLDAELETAKAVQTALLPKADPKLDNIEIESYYKSAAKTGGDWYGYYLDPKGILHILIGDVTGHGSSSALLAAVAHGSCNTINIFNSMYKDMDLSPELFLNILNTTIYEAGHQMLFMTFFSCSLNPKTGEIKYANAGHNFPLVFRKNIKSRNDRAIGNRQINVLTATGERLGNSKNAKFETCEDRIEQGDILLFYTDGLIECTNETFAEYGKRRLRQILEKNVSLSAKEIKNLILEDTGKYFGKIPPKDDISFIIVKMIK